MDSTTNAGKRSRLIRFKEFQDRIGYGRTRIYELIREGRLPAPVKLPGGRASAWLESDVDAVVARIASGGAA